MGISRRPKWWKTSFTFVRVQGDAWKSKSSLISNDFCTKDATFRMDSPTSPVLHWLPVPSLLYSFIFQEMLGGARIGSPVVSKLRHLAPKWFGESSTVQASIFIYCVKQGGIRKARASFVVGTAGSGLHVLQRFRAIRLGRLLNGKRSAHILLPQKAKFWNHGFWRNDSRQGSY